MESKTDSKSLSKLFDDAFKLYDELENSSQPTNSDEYQSKARKLIKQLEEATEMVNQLSLFSSNEDIKEVNTAHVKYLLLPALLGCSHLKLNSSMPQSRLQYINLAEVYLKDYLKRVKEYGGTSTKLDHIVQSTSEIDEDSAAANPPLDDKAQQMRSLENAALRRNEKIQRYQKDKKLKEKLEYLSKKIEENEESADDDVIREFYLSLIEKWVGTAIDELESIQQEKPILEMMEKRRQEDKDSGEPRRDPQNLIGLPKATPPLKPFIITKNEIQKQVFGIGYPSIPTVSVDDFVTGKIQEGSLSVQNRAIYENSLQKWAEDPEEKDREDEEEAERKEKLEEKEDPENLAKMRGWDDWKDENPRGWGNRKNMG